MNWGLSIEEALPVLKEGTAELADAARAAAVERGDVTGAMAERHVQGDTALAWVIPGQPEGKVMPKGRLFVRRRFGVAAEGLFQEPTSQVSVFVEMLDPEPMLPLGPGRENVRRRLLATEAAATADGAGGERRQRRDETRGVFALADEPAEPEPAERHHFGDELIALVAIMQVSKIDETMEPDPGQDGQEASV